MRAHTKKSAPQHPGEVEHIRCREESQCKAFYPDLIAPQEGCRDCREEQVLLCLHSSTYLATTLSPGMGLLCAALPRLSESSSSTHICVCSFCPATAREMTFSAGWRHSLGSHGFSFKGGAERCLSFGVLTEFSAGTCHSLSILG